MLKVISSLHDGLACYFLYTPKWKDKLKCLLLFEKLMIQRDSTVVASSFLTKTLVISMCTLLKLCRDFTLSKMIQPYFLLISLCFFPCRNCTGKNLIHYLYTQHMRLIQYSTHPHTQHRHNTYFKCLA